MTLIELCGQLILAVILIQDPCMTLKTRLNASYTLHSSCAYSVEVLFELYSMSKLIKRFVLLTLGCFAQMGSTH